MIRLYRLLIPFAIVGILFIIAGYIVPDDRLLYFGIVWLIIALVVFLGNQARRP